MKIHLSFLSRFFDRFFGLDGIVNPKRDWIILLVLLCIGTVSVMAYDGFLYRDIASGDMYVSVSKSELSLESVNETTLNSVVNDFESRQSEIATLKIQKLVDPSL